MPLSVVILAAGQGKRMHSDLPKVLQPLAGQPLLKHVIDTARSLKPQAIFVVYGHGGSRVQEALHADDIDWVLQAQQLGTGHAVMQAIPMIPEDHTVLVLYGDVPLIKRTTLEQLVARQDCLMVLTVELEDPHGYGRIVREGGKVRGIVEQRDATAKQLEIREINTGVLAAPAKALREWLPDVSRNNSQGEYYLTDVVAIAAKGGVTIDTIAASAPAEVAGVNDKVQLAETETHYRRERARELMLAGATLVDPARIDIRGSIRVGRDVCIDINAVLIGDVHLGDGVSIGPNCIIIDSSIGAQTEIFANCIIDHAKVGTACRIGPYARLRPQSVLNEDVHIGNFVEVKNTELGAHSKANHLTYLGDATVGEGVNVGAGSITCNYDGLNKWPTIIEDGAFIGSGTLMVAPVRIGANSTTGAGSTISRSTPDGKLTLARSTQTSSDNWQRPKKYSEQEKAQLIEKATKK